MTDHIIKTKQIIKQNSHGSSCGGQSPLPPYEALAGSGEPWHDGNPLRRICPTKIILEVEKAETANEGNYYYF
jgi:hypothetical protein